MQPMIKEVAYAAMSMFDNGNSVAKIIGQHQCQDGHQDRMVNELRRNNAMRYCL